MSTAPMDLTERSDHFGVEEVHSAMHYAEQHGRSVVIDETGRVQFVINVPKESLPSCGDDNEGPPSRVMDKAAREQLIEIVRKTTGKPETPVLASAVAGIIESYEATFSDLEQKLSDARAALRLAATSCTRIVGYDLKRLRCEVCAAESRDTTSLVTHMPHCPFSALATPVPVAVPATERHICLECGSLIDAHNGPSTFNVDVCWECGEKSPAELNDPVQAAYAKCVRIVATQLQHAELFAEGNNDEVHFYEHEVSVCRELLAEIEAAAERASVKP